MHLPMIQSNFCKQFIRDLIVKLDTNYGFAGGYNKGLAKIAADYFILLNSDVGGICRMDWTDGER